MVLQWTSVTGIKYKKKKYIVKRGNKVHKTTKKYLNLGISQTDFFLKGEITDSNHSVSQNKRVCWAQSKLFAHCKHVWRIDSAMSVDARIVNAVFSENLPSLISYDNFSSCGLYVNCYLCCCYISWFHACLFGQNWSQRRSHISLATESLLERIVRRYIYNTHKN